MTSKEILKDYIPLILDFKLKRELRTNSEFSPLLAMAYEIETGDKNTAASIRGNCNSCISRAVDFFANLFSKEQDNKQEVEEPKQKRKRINNIKPTT
jgi:hypothetical protein